MPQNQPFPLGVNADDAGGGLGRPALRPPEPAHRRLTNLASATVPLFPVTTFITPVFEGGAQGQPIPFTQFIQQPTFTRFTIQTTVSVPDGGTVLLGGLKTLSEGRNEFGPPVLSKIPYIDRLFKNVGYGREHQQPADDGHAADHHQPEEEEKQTGVSESGAVRQ